VVYQTEFPEFIRDNLRYKQIVPQLVNMEDDTVKKYSALISTLALIFFSFNVVVIDFAFALAPRIASQDPDEIERIYAGGQKLFAAMRGPGSELPLRAYKPGWQRPAKVEGGEPVVRGLDFDGIDYASIPEGWYKNLILSKTTDLVRAFKIFKEDEARLSYNYGVTEGYWELKKGGDGEIPICRWERHNVTGQWTLVIHPDFIRMWKDIRENDVWFEYTFPDGKTRTVSLAWAIFYRVAKHEMTDLDMRLRTAKGSGLGHITSGDVSSGHVFVSQDEESANRIGGRYALVNDAIWMWFLGSYCFPGYSAKYNSNVARARYLWFLGSYKGYNSKNLNAKAVELGFNKEFPDLISDSDARDRAIDIAVAVNHRFYSKYIRTEATDREKKMRNEHVKSHGKFRHSVGDTIYAAGMGFSTAEEGILARIDTNMDASSIGDCPGVTDSEPSVMDRVLFYPFFKELNTQNVEIYIPQGLLLTPSVESAVKSLNERIRQRRDGDGLPECAGVKPIEIKKYNAMNLDKMLARKDSGSRRIFVADQSTVGDFRMLLDSGRQDLFRGNRLLTADTPQVNDDTENSVHQAWLIKVAMLSCLLTEDNYMTVGTALEQEINGKIEDNAEEYISRLAQVSKENLDNRDVSSRVNYFLGKVVRLSQLVAEQLKILKAFWTAA